MYQKVKTVGYFSTTYDLILSQFHGTGTCFYKYYLLPDKDILPETYAREYYKQLQNKQIDLGINDYQCATLDLQFDHNIYQITPYVALKERSFLFSIFSEVPQIVNSILITGYILNGNTITELPFCQLVIQDEYVLEQGAVFDSEIKLFYPIPVRSGIMISNSQVPELFQSVLTDYLYTFTCASIFSSTFKIRCFEYFDLFNYYNYNQRLLDVVRQNQPITFVVNDKYDNELSRDIYYVEKLSNKYITFEIRVPLDITQTISSISVKKGSIVSTVNFDPIVVCSNYVNTGNNYLTVDIEVNVTRWLSYLSFMIRL